MRQCFVNPSLPHFLGYPLKLASDVIYVADEDGRLRPSLLPVDEEHASAIRSMFYFKDVEETEQDSVAVEDESPEQPAEQPEDRLDGVETETVSEAEPVVATDDAAARAVLSKILDVGAPTKKVGTRKKKT